MGLILEARRHLFESVAYRKRLETADVLSKGPDSCVGVGARGDRSNDDVSIYRVKHRDGMISKVSMFVIDEND
jgi:hypothetical protein